MRSEIIRRYLIHKLTIPISEATILIDELILKLVKLQNKKPLLNEAAMQNREIEIDSLIKDTEYAIGKLNIKS